MAIDRSDAASAQPEPIVIGIGGGTGAGKTTLANQIVQTWREWSPAILDLDSYYRDRSELPYADRALVNYDEPAAIDFELLCGHLEVLLRGQNIPKPVYCFATHSRKRGTQSVPATRLLIVEGLFALWHAALRRLMTLKLYVHAEPDLRFIRRLERDTRERGRTVDSVVEQYLKTVRPMHLAYIEPTRIHADLVMNGAGWEGENWAALAARITRLLAAPTTRPVSLKAGAG